MIELQGAATREPALPAPPAGVSFAVDTGAVSGSDCALARLRRQVFEALANGASVGLSLRSPAAAPQAAEDLAVLCQTLADAAADAAVAPARIEITLPATWLPPRDVLAIRHAHLGAGKTWLRADAGTFVPTADVAAAAATFWQELWQLRASGELACTFADAVVSACPLLSTEHADAVLPPLGLQCPAATAWVCLPFDVASCADDQGRIDRAALTVQLEAVIDTAERLHDTAAWPTAAMRNDAWRNRRVAISLTGFGDIAVRMGCWPADRQCTVLLTGLVRSIRRIVIARSRELAHTLDTLPALTEHDPVPKLGAAAQPAWQARWARALDAVGTRHRNLLAMSPASVLPTDRVFDRPSFELLPLLEHVDAWCIPPPSLQGSLNINEFRELHRRSWAVLQRRNGRRLVAEQV